MVSKSLLEEEFVDFLSGVWQGFGLDQLSSRLVGMIFIEPDPVAMEDLAERTGYSLASVSNKLKVLEFHKMVVRVKRPGTKKAYYYIEKDCFDIMRRKFASMKAGYITPAKNALPNMIEKHKKAKMSVSDRKKLEIVENYHKQLLKMEVIFDDLLKAMENSR